MKYSTAKAKGRNHQIKCVKAMREQFKKFLEDNDLRSTPMGMKGPDVLLSPKAEKIFPFAIECKKVEKINIWEAIDQAIAFKQGEPLVLFSKNHRETYAAVNLDLFLILLEHYYETYSHGVAPLDDRGRIPNPLLETAKNRYRGEDGL